MALVVAGCAVLACGCSRVEPLRPRPDAVSDADQEPVPVIDRPVVDMTQTLSAPDVDALTERLLALRERTSAQMAVLLVWTTGEEPIADYSMRVAEAWRGGSAERDDGLLLTLALVDRRMRLEVGYGLEPSIIDSEAQAILDAMREDLRAGDTEGAIAGAIERVARELPRTGGSLLEGGALASPERGIFTGAPITLVALALALATVRARREARRGGRRARGPAWVWGALLGAVALVALLFAWLYADLMGPSSDAALALAGATLALVGPCIWIDGRARDAPSGMARGAVIAVLGALAAVPVMGVVGGVLGSPEAPILVAVAVVVFLVLLPFLIASSGGGSSYSGSSYSGSSGSDASSSYGSSYSSSSSSSSDYSGHGGGFGGGGASSSW